MKTLGTVHNLELLGKLCHSVIFFSGHPQTSRPLIAALAVRPRSVQTQSTAMNLVGGLCAPTGQIADINDQLATVFRSINLYLYFAN